MLKKTAQFFREYADEIFMANPLSPNHRKLVLINPRFQLMFLGFMVIMAALVIAAIYGANLYFFWKFQKYGESVRLPPDHVFFVFLDQQRVTMNRVFWVTSASVFSLITVLGLVMSHRIAGPLYRLTKHLRNTAASHKYSPVKFREKDFFPEIADAYNEQLPVDSSVRDDGRGAA